MGMSVSLLDLMSRLVLEWLINTSLPHAVTHRRSRCEVTLKLMHLKQYVNIRA